MSDNEKTRTITLFDRRPVKIREAEWPVIARASDHDNQYEFQANRRWNLRVRQHADGRAIVYGTYDTAFQHEANRAGGELLEAGEDVAATVARVAKRLGFADHIAEACVADLPAEDLS